MCIGVRVDFIVNQPAVFAQTFGRAHISALPLGVCFLTSVHYFIL